MPDMRLRLRLSVTCAFDRFVLVFPDVVRRVVLRGGGVHRAPYDVAACFLSGVAWVLVQAHRARELAQRLTRLHPVARR